MNPIADTDALDRADMERLATGSDTALNALMERHAGRVFNYLVRLLGDFEDAEDLAQETFVRVFRSKARFNPEKCFATWLYTIASNLARNHYRWRSRHPEACFDDDQLARLESGNDPGSQASPTPAEALDRTERAVAIRKAVNRLPKPLREVVVLCEWENLSIADAASILETTPKALETKLYRARKQLRLTLACWL